MAKQMIGNSEYGNWVPEKFIYVPGVTSFVFLGLALLFPVLVILAALFLFVSIYFAYARYQFAPQGGNLERKIRELVLAHLDWNGEGQALDIGCGNAPLTIMLAHKYPKARLIGIDYWGKKWGYSKNICERNARVEGINERVTFQTASASALPFDNGAFDVAVSNLVFHEVSAVKDKKNVIKEALRVVKKGGSFAFQDLFLWKRVYGEVDDLIQTVKSWGIEKVDFVSTGDSEFIPKGLRLPFMVGAMGILYGRK